MLVLGDAPEGPFVKQRAPARGDGARMVRVDSLLGDRQRGGNLDSLSVNLAALTSHLGKRHGRHRHVCYGGETAAGGAGQARERFDAVQ